MLRLGKGIMQGTVSRVQALPFCNMEGIKGHRGRTGESLLLQPLNLQRFLTNYAQQCFVTSSLLKHLQVTTPGRVLPRIPLTVGPIRRLKISATSTRQLDLQPALLVVVAIQRRNQ